MLWNKENVVHAAQTLGVSEVVDYGSLISLRFGDLWVMLRQEGDEWMEWSETDRGEFFGTLNEPINIFRYEIAQHAVVSGWERSWG